MAYKLAIIGYGGMGSWHQKSVKQYIGGIEVKGIYDIREEAKEKAMEQGLYSYNTVDELLSDEEIDLVTIAVPNNFHKDYAIAALRHNKHVICEKPVTMNAAELEEIMKVSKETGKVFSIHQNRRWDRDYKIILKLIEDGTIGTPYFIESRVQGSGRMLYGWRGHKVNGGGMVYDWGVHLLDQILMMVDSPVVSVSAHLTHLLYKEVDDNCKIFLKFENGMSALVEVATNCFINQPRWHVAGTDGTAVIHNWECQGEVVKLANKEALTWSDDIVYTVAGPTRTMAPRPDETKLKLELPEVETSWTAYYQNMIEVLDGKAELIVKPEQALRVMKLIDLIFESEKQSKHCECRI